MAVYKRPYVTLLDSKNLYHLSNFFDFLRPENSNLLIVHNDVHFSIAFGMYKTDMKCEKGMQDGINHMLIFK